MTFADFCADFWKHSGGGPGSAPIAVAAFTWDAATAAERARIVALLREWVDGWNDEAGRDIRLVADAIEKGEG